MFIDLSHIVPPPHLYAGGGGGGIEPLAKFFLKSGRLDKISIFRGGLLRKKGWLFFREVCSFYIENKLKFEISDIKKHL